MRIDELKRIAEKNNYIIEKRYRMGFKEIVLKSCRYGHPETIAVINNHKENVVFFSNDYCYDSDLEMIKAAVEFAETPLEDRVKEKKFYLKHRWLENGGESSYLNFEISGLYYSLNTKCKANWAKTKFTNKDIEEIKEKFDTDLADFELVEVEE